MLGGRLCTPETCEPKQIRFCSVDNYDVDQHWYHHPPCIYSLVCSYFMGWEKRKEENIHFLIIYTDRGANSLSFSLYLCSNSTRTKRRGGEENIPLLILNADRGANTFQKHINCKIHFYNKKCQEKRENQLWILAICQI